LGLAVKSEGKRPLGRPTLRWEDNIKMNLQEVECGDIVYVLTDSIYCRGLMMIPTGSKRVA
jgi:hypothetical protein